MPGIARNYNANQIILGPADVWLDVNLPAPGARLSIDADGTPASTNTTAIHLGMTAAGVTFEYMPEIQDFTSDELTAPHMSRIISEKASLKGEFLQVFNWSLLAKMTVGGSLGTATGTAGYEELKMGGISSISTFSVALIGPDISNSSEFYCVQLYKTYNKSGFTFAVTRKDQSRAPFEFSGLAVRSRASGDQIANFWHQGAANS